MSHNGPWITVYLTSFASVPSKSPHALLQACVHLITFASVLKADSWHRAILTCVAEALTTLEAIFSSDRALLDAGRSSEASFRLKKQHIESLPDPATDQPHKWNHPSGAVNNMEHAFMMRHASTVLGMRYAVKD